MPSTIQHSLTIGWLYPDLMSTYGDRGNILVLQRRCEWRGIQVNILPIEQSTTTKQLEKVDLLFGGGAQDHAQSIVMDDLRKGKGEKIKAMIESELPALFVCGSPQLMGEYYEPSEGQRIDGLRIFDMYTVHPGAHKPRLTGNIVATIIWDNFSTSDFQSSSDTIVGFENHGGRTYLGPTAKPFATVVKGNGNNGKDGTEGVVYNNAIGCYFHGPLLPKNPAIADFLIHTSLKRKYQDPIALPPLDDSLENSTREQVKEKVIMQ